MALSFGPRRATYIDVTEQLDDDVLPLSTTELAAFEELDLIYRSLCAALYNYVPGSGHPGGSISSGRFVASLVFGGIDADVSHPDRDDADILSYAAGHKALGLYAMWALRNEIARLGAPELLPADPKFQLRMEDLLGFRRNPITDTPLFLRHRAKPLDGHPTPATPFVKLATGASGVGVASSLGLAFGARDYFGHDAPRVHIVEGEGGLTPGRVVEALAGGGTGCLDNAFIHLDWNQASIDTNQVCREGDQPGDYVQWNPMELFYLHDWNVIYVPDGKDFQQVMAAQRIAGSRKTTQPTAIVYRTVKGWQYGIEGRASHGAGHALCSEGFHQALKPLLGEREAKVPSCCDLKNTRCSGPDGGTVMEACFWESLEILRREIGERKPMFQLLAGRLREAKKRLDARGRKPREGAPRVEAVYEVAASDAGRIPPEVEAKAGAVTTLRGELGRVLNYYNQKSGGALMIAAADLLGSTSVSKAAEGFEVGYWNAADNIESRTLSIGGICEDGMSGVFSGMSSFGKHIGIASSYAAFLAPLGHIAARLHAIGGQARKSVTGEPYRPMILVCAHAGLKTGEDGPTHADPQALQLLQENFPRGTVVTLTPWEPQEIWSLVSAALAKRPALIAPFVTRPNETVPDRAMQGLPPATEAVNGLYALRKARGKGDGTLVLQESGVTLVFVKDVLPRLEQAGIDLNVYYVASAELFDMLPAADRARIFPEERAREAMGITGFTLPTLYRWVHSHRGREASLHPFQKGHFLGSGQAHFVMAEAGLDGESQFRAIRAYLNQAVHAR
jgi:transketolase